MLPLDTVAEAVIAKGDLAHLTLLLWAGAASYLALRGGTAAPSHADEERWPSPLPLSHPGEGFREIYNATWLIERHGFRPPAAIRAAQLPPAALPA